MISQSAWPEKIDWKLFTTLVHVSELNSNKRYFFQTFFFYLSISSSVLDSVFAPLSSYILVSVRLVSNATF